MSITSPAPTLPPEHPTQTRLALAALAACFAVSHAKQSESSLAQFEDALQVLYRHIGDTSEVDNSGALETLRWTRHFVRVLKQQD